MCTIILCEADFNMRRERLCLLLPKQFVPQKCRATCAKSEVTHDSSHF